MDLAVILAAFVFGFAAVRIGLPPLVGYLAAGFALHAAGVESGPGIEFVAELGVLLLLFGIGLKLRIGDLVRKEVWAVAATHMAVATATIAASILVLGALGFSLASGLSLPAALLVGFGFSFSSTVFAIKALEERNETASLSGGLAIGILIMQDLFAVAFLALSLGKAPSPWSVLLIAGIVAARPVFGWLLRHSGHGELMVLFGLVVAIGIGGEAFQLVGIKPDLGVLIVGMSLASHPRAPELADRLLGFKDVLLVGFFLTIGLGGTPGPPALIVAGIAIVMLAGKSVGFLVLLTRFRLRARTSLHTALTLGTYSEFGLIVAGAGVDQGVLDPQWLSAMAVALAVSFALAAPVNRARYDVYGRWAHWLTRLERDPILPEDALVEPTTARVVVFGMGRVGMGAYDELVRIYGPVVLGVDRRDATVVANAAAGRTVLRGDALDRDFWDRLRLHPGLELAVLAMNDHDANLEATHRVREYLPGIKVAATARYPDQVTELQAAGVDVARNLYEEAGQGLADDAAVLLGADPPDPA